MNTSLRVAKALDHASNEILNGSSTVESAIEIGVRLCPSNQRPSREKVIDAICLWWNGVGETKNPWSWDRISVYMDTRPNGASLLNQCADFWRGGN